MAQQVSAGALAKWKQKAESLAGRVKKVAEKGEKTVETVTGTLVVSGTSFAFGVLQGRTGGVEVVGVPIELLTGVGLHVAGFMGLGGRRSDMLHHVGNGAMATYAATMGRSVGVNWKKTGKLLAGNGATSAGELPEVGTDFLTDEQIANSVIRR